MPQPTIKIAEELQRRVAVIPGAVDVHINQQVHTPPIEVERGPQQSRSGRPDAARRRQQHADFAQLQRPGRAQPVAESGQRRELPGRRADAAVSHRFARCAAPHARSPAANGGSTQLLDNLVSNVQRSSPPSIVNHYNVQPVFDVFANVDQRDLGGVARDIEKIMERDAEDSPKASTIVVRGQVETMKTSFRRLGFGMLFAILLVYLLMVVNFQSWLDPFIILTALPGAFAGILWMLFATQTTINVPSLMGAIMAIGVATANSILLVTFANDERLDRQEMHIEAALSAGYTRIRPCMMTALAMIIGMLPMALGLGEGGEQNAPLAAR